MPESKQAHRNPQGPTRDQVIESYLRQLVLSIEAGVRKDSDPDFDGASSFTATFDGRWIDLINGFMATA